MSLCKACCGTCCKLCTVRRACQVAGCARWFRDQQTQWATHSNSCDRQFKTADHSSCVSMTNHCSVQISVRMLLRKCLAAGNMQYHCLLSMLQVRSVQQGCGNRHDKQHETGVQQPGLAHHIQWPASERGIPVRMSLWCCQCVVLVQHGRDMCMCLCLLRCHVGMGMLAA